MLEVENSEPFKETRFRQLLGTLEGLVYKISYPGKMRFYQLLQRLKSDFTDPEKTLKTFKKGTLTTRTNVPLHFFYLIA